MNPPIRRSPVSRIHADLGAVFEHEAGWELPSAYGSNGVERALLTTSVAVADITARAKIDVRGSIDTALGSAGDAPVARIADDWALVLGEPGDEEVLLPKLEAGAGPGVMVTDATHAFAGFALAGPDLPDLLARTTSWDPSTLSTGDATGAPIADIGAVIVRREPSFLEVYVAVEFARYAWRTLHEAAAGLGGGAVGWNALRASGWR